MMKAAVLEAYHRPLVVREVGLAPPARGEVAVEVKACGPWCQATSVPASSRGWARP